MGAKAPEKLKLRRPPCKCDVCGRKFLNAAAVSSHRKFMHKNKSVPTKPVPFRKPREDKREKLMKKKILKAPVKKNVSQNSSPKVKKVAPTQSPKVTNKEVPKAGNVVPTVKKASSNKKVGFKCPKCDKMFTVYFSAHRHIQKYHCVDENGEAVSTSSPNLIKPLRLEPCQSCNKCMTPAEAQIHVCKTTVESVSCFMCLGCQQTFTDLVLFEEHVKGLHGSGVEHLFFPNVGEFTTWKADLEKGTDTKFISQDPNQKSKQIYYCSHQSSVSPAKTLQCPATIAVTEYTTGQQISYYKEHFGHSLLDFPENSHKKYSIQNFLKDIPIQNGTEDNKHQQFKNIMESIILKAAKADPNVLHSLLGKAFEMSLVINSNQVTEEQNVNKTMTDEQITEVLAEVKTYPGKKKSDAVKDVKKVKPTLENDENSASNKKLKTATEDSPPANVAKSFVQSPISFNDSYKDFIGQTLKTISDNSTPKRSTVKKKEVMKTKIGQFKVRSSLSPIKPKPKVIQYNIKRDIEYEVLEQENDCNILILKI